MLTLSKKNKKGQAGGLITGLVLGIASLVIAVIISFVFTSTVNNAGLLTAGTNEQNATNTLISNYTTGVTNVSNKLPQVLLVAGIVLIFGVLVLLAGAWQRMRFGQGSAI